MKNRNITLNKDGTPRKSGSGRRKGANSFVKVSFDQLKEYIGEKTPITVSRVWLENLGFSLEPSQNTPKIDLTSDEKSDNVLYTVNTFED